MKNQIVKGNIIFAILATAFMAFAIQGISYGAATVSVVPDAESPAAGATLMVSIKIEGGTDVTGYGFDLIFDPAVLMFDKIENADYLSTGAFPVPLITTEGKVTFGAITAPPNPSSGDGTLAKVTFTVQTTDMTTIGFGGVLLFSGVETIPDVTVMAAEINAVVEPEPTPEPMPPMPAPPITEDQMFEVTLTNLTEGMIGEAGQGLSPALFVSHTSAVTILEAGMPASAELRVLAESGNNMPLAESAKAMEGVKAVMSADGVLLPGMSTTVKITGGADGWLLSFASMLVQTNDGIAAANSLPLFDESGAPRTFMMDIMTYDAGTEDNNELATHVPGPPFMGMAEAPTEGGIIMMHPGNAGTADVGAAFSWAEPVARLSVMPYVAPTDPDMGDTDTGDTDTGDTDTGDTDTGDTDTGDTDTGDTDTGDTDTGDMPEPDMPKMSTFMMHLYPGLNMISLPLKPEMPFTARSLAMHLGATTVIMLDSGMQEFVGFTPDSMGDGFEIKGGMGYIVNVPDGGYAKFTGTAWGEPMEAPMEEAPVAAAPSGVALRTDAWAFVVSGHPLDMKRGSTYTVVAKNLSRGTVALNSVSRKSGHYATVWADLGRKSVAKAGDLLEITMVDQHGNIVSGPFQRVVSVSNIRDAYLSVRLRVGDVHPEKTTLAQNFPNPFNPETWLPFQLAKSANVTIQIYDRSGHLVRTFPLGFRPAGFYTTRSAAVYWDGRSNTGERVASGLYFYTMQTNKNFTATRRMLIVK